MTSDDDARVREVHEAWLRACRVDDLLSRFDEPPQSSDLVRVVLQRAQSGTRPPDPVLAGAAKGFSANQWTVKSGEIVQRQLGRLMLVVADFVPAEARVIAEIHMVVSASAAQVSLDAWRGQAETDELTRLRNDFGLAADLDAVIAARRTFQLGFIDLDGLKKVNTEAGHEAGDRLIRTFANRLKETIHPLGGLAYRPHGDEFICVLPHDQGDLAEALGQLETSPDFAFSWGVAEWPSDDNDVETVRRLADQAMYEMKGRHHEAQGVPEEIHEETTPLVVDR